MESHYNQTGSWLLSSLLPSSTSLLVQLCCNSPTSTMFVFSLGEVKFQIFFQVWLNIFRSVVSTFSLLVVCRAGGGCDLSRGDAGCEWWLVLSPLLTPHLPPRLGWSSHPRPATTIHQPSPAHQIKAATIFRGIFHSHCNQRRYGECKNLFRQYYLPSI